MTKGRKPIQKTDEAALPMAPPLADLSTPLEQEAYRTLRADLSRSGFAERCDLQTLILAAQRKARIARIKIEVEALPCLTIEGGRLHPLLAELRNCETGLLAALGSLNLTPRSRSSSRAKATEMSTPSGWEYETDPMKRGLLRRLDGLPFEE